MKNLIKYPDGDVCWYKTPIGDYFPPDELDRLVAEVNDMRSGKFDESGLYYRGPVWLDFDGIGRLLENEQAWLEKKGAAWRAIKDAAWADAQVSVEAAFRWNWDEQRKFNRVARHIIEAKDYPPVPASLAGMAAEAMLTDDPPRILGHLWRFAANHMGPWKDEAGVAEEHLLEQYEGWQYLPEWPDTRPELGVALNAVRKHWDEIVEAAGGLPRLAGATPPVAEPQETLEEIQALDDYFDGLTDAPPAWARQQGTRGAADE